MVNCFPRVAEEAGDHLTLMCQRRARSAPPPHSCLQKVQPGEVSDTTLLRRAFESEIGEGAIRSLIMDADGDRSGKLAERLPFLPDRSCSSATRSLSLSPPAVSRGAVMMKYGFPAPIADQCRPINPSFRLSPHLLLRILRRGYKIKDKRRQLTASLDGEVSDPAIDW